MLARYRHYFLAFAELKAELTEIFDDDLQEFFAK